MTNETTQNLRLGTLQLLAGASLISFSAVFVRLATVGPTMAGFYRTLFGGVFLLIVVVVRREPLWGGRGPLLMALTAAALFASDLSFWHRSILYIGPGLGTLMANFQVFFLAAFGVLVFKEKAGWRFLVSVPIAFTGLFMLVGSDWSALESDYRLGVYFGFVTALSYASYVLVLRKSQSGEQRLSASANLVVISLGVATIMGVEGYLQGESFRIPDALSWTSMLAYGILCHAMGWILISHGLVKVEASRAGLLLLLQPTLAFIWDGLFFARPTGIMDVSGALLALVAIYLGGTGKSR